MTETKDLLDKAMKEEGFKPAPVSALGPRGTKVIDEVLAERKHQDEKFGGPVHDDGHTGRDWIAFIVEHLGRAGTQVFAGDNFRKQMIKVAALAIAAVEWYDRGAFKPGVCEPEDEVDEAYERFKFRENYRTP